MSDFLAMESNAPAGGAGARATLDGETIEAPRSSRR